MIGYARYDYAKYDSNILKQIKRCTDHLSSHGYPRATVSCLEPCQLAGLSFIPRRLTVTAVFCELWPTLQMVWLHQSACSEPFPYEPGHSLDYKTACAPTKSKDSDQPVYPRCLIRVFAVLFVGRQGSKASSGGQWRLWIKFADVQSDLSSLLSSRTCCTPAHLWSQI